MSLKQPEELFKRSMTDLGMKEQSNNPFGCGVFYKGDSLISEGEYWCFWHKDLFYFARCDFRVSRDIPMSMPAVRYLCLRWSGVRTKRLHSFYEENGREAHALLKKDSHVAYFEIFYLPEVYRHLFDTSTENGFSGISPIERLQSLNASSNWPSSLLHTFKEIEEYRESGHAARLYYTGKGYELLSYLMQAGRGEPTIAARDLDPILAVTEHINTHYRQPIRQSELVQISHMSASKLKDIFRRFTGKSLTDYIKAIRLEKADELLAGSNLTIEEIASQVGYETPTGFATAFRKHAGISPREFRKRMSFECTVNPSQTFDGSPDTTYVPRWW